MGKGERGHRVFRVVGDGNEGGAAAWAFLPDFLTVKSGISPGGRVVVFFVWLFNLLKSVCLIAY